MSEVVIPFYLNWSFWTVCVATLALVLSQLPPIHMIFKRAKLDMELYSRIHITHKVGNPNLDLHLILNNIGGKVVRIKEISATIKRNGEQIAQLPAQSYLQNPDSKTPILLTSFSLKPKEEWAHSVKFLNYFSRNEEKEYRSAEQNLKENILNKRELSQNKDILIEADTEYLKTFIRMYKSKFLWSANEYEIQVSIKGKNQKANIQKKYRFTLFESDEEELSKFIQAYKYGDGIFWESGKHPGVIVQIVEA